MRKNLLLKTLCSFFICMSLQSVSAQNVGINTAPDASAALDISSNNRGLLIPRVTTAERNAFPNLAAGLMVYDKDIKSFYFYNGTAWAAVGGSSSSSPAFIASAGIGSTNGSGNGTYYLTYSTGASLNEADNHRVLLTPATSIKFTAVATGPLSSSYTFSIRKGTPTANGFYL